MQLRHKVVTAMLGACLAAAGMLAAAPAHADVIDGGDVYYGATNCHGYIVKDAPNYVYAVVVGDCQVSIDSAHGPTWAKPGGWQHGSTAPSGSVFVGYWPGDAVKWGATVCITPDPRYFREQCGPLVWG